MDGGSKGLSKPSAQHRLARKQHIRETITQVTISINRTAPGAAKIKPREPYCHQHSQKTQTARELFKCSRESRPAYCSRLEFGKPARWTCYNWLRKGPCLGSSIAKPFQVARLRKNLRKQLPTITNAMPISNPPPNRIEAAGWQSVKPLRTKRTSFLSTRPLFRTHVSAWRNR